MSESVAVVHWDDAKHYRCPFDRGQCEGAQCMAWVNKEDAKGESIGTGRCGMVPAPVLTYPTFAPAPPASEPRLYAADHLPIRGAIVLVRNTEKWLPARFERYHRDVPAYKWEDTDGGRWVMCAEYDEQIMLRSL